MNRKTAENTITEYLKPIFGFCLKHCKSIQDAEDLSQEIVLKAFNSLIKKDDISDASKFIWTIAHNALSNYYRDSSKSIVGVSIDEVAEIVPDPDSELWEANDGDAVKRLQREIAYLSKLQRKIVIAYYFENRKQADIAESLGIPLGTVKWHLFEAKKELKRGIDTMRKASDLKFNPIKFKSIGFSGSMGKISPEEFFRSPLVQNICYSVRGTAKTVNEIADDLGVSPVYVEAEAEHLEKYGFLQARKDKYILNFVIYEPTAELLAIQNDMYKKAAELFANDLYDELVVSGVMDDPEIICCQTKGAVSLHEDPAPDRNFLLWTLIPYIAAWSGEGMMDSGITFKDVATIRPDGAENIVHALVLPDDMALPEEYAYLNDWYGPMWNGIGNDILWQIDSGWSDRVSPNERSVPEEARKVIALYNSERENVLSEYDYAWLAERGYIKTTGCVEGMFKSAWQMIVLDGNGINARLLAIGDRIKRKYKEELMRIRESCMEAVLDSVPAHLRKVKEYEMQFVFNSDGVFLLHCVLCLLKNGKLKEPAQGQRKALTTLLVRKHG